MGLTEYKKGAKTRSYFNTLHEGALAKRQEYKERGYAAANARSWSSSDWSTY